MAAMLLPELGIDRPPLAVCCLILLREAAAPLKLPDLTPPGLEVSANRWS